MEKGGTKIVRDNATSVSLNVMIFKLCDIKINLTIEIYITKINFDVIERKQQVNYFFVFLLRISI